MSRHTSTPRILIIAGSDSGGGAGIQADIKTVTMLGGHAMTAVTAITAQNTLGVQAVMPVPTEMVIAQIESCVSDIGVDAVKIGMIGSAETAHAVADWLEKLSANPSPSGEGQGWGLSSGQSVVGEAPPPSPPLKGRGEKLPIIFDPVMVASSGDRLADDATIAAFERLMRLATIVTPNLPELHKLGGSAAVLGHGCALLAKGGHDRGDVLTDRLIDEDGELRWLSGRIATTSTHGTGCTLASAIATYLAYGYPLKAAVASARQFVRIALKDAPGLGGGHGPMGHQNVRLDLGPGVRLNQTTLPMAAGSEAFYRTLGLTQIVATDDGHYARFEADGGATLSVEQGAAPTVFFECEDLDAEVARLQAAGVVFDHLPVAQEWLWREARLTDPAGNAICLYQAGENRRFPPWRLKK
ncbi:MAG: bifunctional hydroxymethylpyrimidine kinase/phosphomethylpyrimidine kinase [Sphingomonas sp.]|uniref:bifunctional hydroxymethylpyrimidine kinase/phosphomethylpyrimidine kinase n=1 Tax=Sphingomonas sp. TaxID=28214 RepID=UPI0025F1D2B2|nr:bifunctional hydroxymethylpyrimidine kinase/phosphomethylpyrimidine kinase [Sphingomonas sp.]MBY0282438.1 bifunctional hydroxymethylpyrimidine kinase/phosphomethylpyrimidine kinase [Sphingomonas sp.]